MRPSLAASLLLLCPAAQVSLLAQAQNPMALQAVPADAQDAATGRGGGAAHTGVYSGNGNSRISQSEVGIPGERADFVVAGGSWEHSVRWQQ